MARLWWVKHVPCNRDTVLDWLRDFGPAEVADIQIRLDPHCGCCYTPSAVLRVLRSLERDGLIRHDGDAWEAVGQ